MPQRRIFLREAELAAAVRERRTTPAKSRHRVCAICGDRLDAANTCAHVRKLALPREGLP
jgi:hypothetical protein